MFTNGHLWVEVIDTGELGQLYACTYVAGLVRQQMVGDAHLSVGKRGGGRPV